MHRQVTIQTVCMFRTPTPFSQCVGREYQILGKDDVDPMQRKNMAAVVNYCCFAGTAQLPTLPLATLAGQVVRAATYLEPNDDNGGGQVRGADVTGGRQVLVKRGKGRGRPGPGQPRGET